MRLHRTLLFLAAACVAAAAPAQQGAVLATPERDGAAVFVAQGSYVVGRLGRECLDVIGRPETPEKLVAAWRERNARFVDASAKYLDLRLQEAEATGGTARRVSALAEIRAVVQANGENSLRTLMQGRKEDACMRVITLLDSGALDISSKLPQYDQLEALVRWAER
ncbi:hypothetical protein H8N03_05365 [Ramlibacter sp. USB13]|uniref:Uncharacterized protein n=1 Tax=Ramlibacter cellulosilyticus TaxID=2764187 RepID=A0A923MR87_9BURK|nr:hypothetical protein [Ramlibacter cellulosilyticus]MBC5782362.1 hypothetical protein [Ramlibacter cellulosilyticus]